MSAILPVNVENLLRGGGVESERVEFKASWDENTTGPQVLRTICAFANDYHNLNGGYVVIGVDEREGRAVLPPSGLRAEEVEAAQQWIRGNCGRLDPSYQPILSPEDLAGRLVLVIWAPASDVKPHCAPDGRGNAAQRRWRYWVRLGAETVDAEQRGDLLRGLIAQTARVPWDDRRAQNAEVADLQETKVRAFLHDVHSGLNEPDARSVYRRMRLTTKVNDHEVPRNAGLLFFAQDASEWFRGATVEVVQFAADRAGDVQEERKFRGTLVDQLRDCLNYLENLLTYHVQKRPDQHQADTWVSYPMPALRETLVNAVYHRSYDVDQPEPTKVYLFPDRVEIISYPGPVPGIGARHLLPNAPVRAVPARNRRIGELLKELRLAEGRLSGLPKVFQAMEANGSPTPRFEFDEQRTFFQATLPAHSEYIALSALRDAAHLRALGDEQAALHRVEVAWRANPAAAALASELIRAYARRQAMEQAEAVFETFAAQAAPNAVVHVANTLIDVARATGDETRAKRLLRDAVSHRRAKTPPRN